MVVYLRRRRGRVCALAVIVRLRGRRDRASAFELAPPS